MALTKNKFFFNLSFLVFTVSFEKVHTVAKKSYKKDNA